MKTIPFSILLLSIAVPCAAQTREKFDIVTFACPRAWTRVDSNGGILLESARTRNGLTSFGQIYLYPSRAAGGSAVSNFADEWRTHVTAHLGPNDQPEPHIETTRDGWTIATGAAQVSRNNLRFTCMLISATGFGKVMSFLVNTAGQDYVKEIDDFFKSLEFDRALASAPPAPAPRSDNAANVPAGSNNGVFYAGIQAATEGFNYGNSRRFLYLNPANHTFRWGFCQEGYYQYSTERDRATNPDFAGTYRTGPNTVTLNFYSSRRMEFIINANGDLEEESAGYRLTKLPQLNARLLEGRYIKADLERSLWPNGRQPAAVFTRNGRFEDEGLLCMGLSEDLSLPLDELNRRNRDNRMPGKGSYAIADSSLMLTYDDGRRRQLLIYLFGADADKTSPGLIVVAGLSFSLVK